MAFHSDPIDPGSLLGILEAEIDSTFQGKTNEELYLHMELDKETTIEEEIELKVYTYFYLFTRTRSTRYLEQAARRTQAWAAIPTVGPGNANRSRRFHILDKLVFKMTCDEKILEDVMLDIHESLLEATPQGHPDQAYMLNTVEIWLRKRYERTESLEDIDRAIEIINSLMNSVQYQFDKTELSSTLGIWVGRRFQRTGSTHDLNHAIDVFDAVVNTPSSEDFIQAGRLHNLGICFGERFERFGSENDLNRAITMIDTAVDMLPQDHSSRLLFLNHLGHWLGCRFERNGLVEDLNRAIEVIGTALDATPQDHPLRAEYLVGLGNQLGSRFDRFGLMGDLNRAIELIDTAVNAMPQGHANHVAWTNTLGVWFGRRYERTGSIDDLNYAIKDLDMVIDNTPKDHSERAGRLHNLGICLSRRYERIGSTKDLIRALNVIRLSVDLTAQDSYDWAERMNNLGICLGRVFEQPTGSMDDLNLAIETLEKAGNALPQNHPDRAGTLNNLGIWLHVRYRQLKLTDDLNRAIAAANMAISLTDHNHPDRTARLSSLGNHLGKRFEQDGSMDDLNHQLSSYIEGWNCLNAPPTDRICSARDAAEILTSQLRWEESSSLLQEAVQLLPSVSPRSLQHTDKQHKLKELAGIASMATAAALNAGEKPYHALRLLESGRSIIASLLIEMRGNIADLEQQHPRLANEFVFLRNQLDLPKSNTISQSLAGSTKFWQAQTEQRNEADKRFSELTKEIRGQPGFESFLLPPNADEVMDAAKSGPIIVINMSSFRCDAFLIGRDQIRLLQLPGLTLQEAQNRIQSLRLSDHDISSQISLLEWLWDNVCGPSLEALGFKSPILNDDWPRVWWIPTGLLCKLPLHAAGYHTRELTRTVLDRVMSSYILSVKVLVNGRLVRQPTGNSPNHALLVAMRETPSSRPLPSVPGETEVFEKLCASLQLKLNTPVPRKDDVLKHLETTRIFHFAGHGESNPLEPSQSCLLLEDWQTNPLTVGNLRDHSFQKNPPFLGYLSACSTGANEVDTLLDEGIHLVGALQLAGFRHVVGTLWEVSDKQCVNVARILYETIREKGVTDLAVCSGLHQALKSLRDGQIKQEPEDAQIMKTIKDGQVKRVSEDDQTKEVLNDRHATWQGSGTRTNSLVNLYWVPYVHFGCF